MATIDTFRRGILPNALAEDVHELLWTCSPFPFTRDVRKIRRSIRRCLRLGGGTVRGAIQYAYDELDRAFAEYEAADTQATP